MIKIKRQILWGHLELKRQNVCMPYGMAGVFIKKKQQLQQDIRTGQLIYIYLSK